MPATTTETTTPRTHRVKTQHNNTVFSPIHTGEDTEIATNQEEIRALAENLNLSIMIGRMLGTVTDPSDNDIHLYCSAHLRAIEGNATNSDFEFLKVFGHNLGLLA